MKYILSIAVIATVFLSCQTSTNYQKVASNPLLYSVTVKQLNDVVLENNFPPMIAARNYAYANIAAYEIIAAGNSKQYQSLAGQLHGLKEIPKPKDAVSINFPFASLIAFCKVGNSVTFPEGSMDSYVDSLKLTMKKAGMPKKVLNKSIEYANQVADAIIAWSKDDNYNALRSASKYTVVNEEGRWVPTPPMYAQALEPHWAEIRPMVLDSCSQFKPIPPPKYDLKKQGTFYNAVMLVKNCVDSLTAEQKHMADFWDDNSFKLNVTGHVMYGTKKFSPAGHWMNIVGIIAAKQHADFETTVAAYAQTSIALFDAFICCWDEKYRSNFVRPETVINKYIDANWRPYLQTPPFPEYTSGHAVISAAAAEIMTHYFGETSYTDSSELEFGIPNRSFASARQAAKEAGLSRVYGGIHYKHSCDIGHEQGIKVGNLVLQRLRMKQTI
jgi:hypothetical protein